MFKRLSIILGLLFSLLIIVRLVGLQDKKAGFVPEKTELVDSKSDSYQWLEATYGDQDRRLSAWVDHESQKTLTTLSGKTQFQPFFDTAFKELNDSSKLPWVQIAGPVIRNVWKDESSLRGLWRQMPYEDFVKGLDSWQVLLDIDSLARAEKKSWVWKGARCLRPDYRRCMLALSDGGQDAVHYREFDTTTRSFVDGGFRLNESKSRVTWLDDDHLLVATAIAEEDRTKAGYPKRLVMWKRGQAFADAVTVDEADIDDVSIGAYSVETQGSDEVFVYHNKSFFESDYYWLSKEKKLYPLSLSQHADIEALISGMLFISLKKDAHGFKAGDLLSVPLDAFSAKNSVESLPFKLVFRPTASQSVTSVFVSKQSLWIIYLDQVKARLVSFTPKAKSSPEAWEKTDYAFPDHGHISYVASSRSHGEVFVTFESFLEPKGMYLVKENLKDPRLIRSSNKQSLSAESYKVEQRFASSTDGTKIPYFIIGRKELFDGGKHPAILYGYGGFNISQTPGFSVIRNELWLKRGGLYAVANIRGGGEFGPLWHSAAQKENRQIAFDDFIAVGESLVSSNLTSPQKLAIMGGSNGGLLVGAVATQRPDLFKAVICMVPLLDMLRYHKLYAGASWIGEYGDPDDPAMRKVLSAYSPFHQLKRHKEFPNFLLLTSSKDDRVHPAHARKMAAKMKAFGLDYLYYENTEGGHAASADFKQMARKYAMIYSFLWDRLQPAGSGLD